MPSLKAIRKRIASVKNTQKITKAMKMVAAAKLRRAQDAVQALRPYAHHLGQIASDVAERLAEQSTEQSLQPSIDQVLSDSETRTAGEGEERGAAAGLSPAERKRLIQRILIGQGEQRIQVVVMSADRGLAGAYNSGLFRRVEKLVSEEAGKQIELVVVGKKGRDYFRRRPFKVKKELPGVDPKTAALRAKELGQLLTEALLGDKVDAIYVVYNDFKSAANTVVKVDRLLPLRMAAAKVARDAVDEPKVLLELDYEPSRDEVLEHLLPLYLQAELHRILLEGLASFYGAQMRAMDSASRNAKEMIGRLTMQYNRARQAAITKELLEIIGGAEALKG